MNDVIEVTASLIIIGDEILSGRTADRNGNYIAKHLQNAGISLCEIRIIPDVEQEIVEAVNQLRVRYDYVFTTGGIGPTHDDITADSIARAFSTSIDIDRRAVEMMRRRYQDSELTGDRLRMARIPKGAELIGNPISHTPGFILENVMVMAGIPEIMQVMMDSVTPKLRKGLPIRTSTIRVIVPESQIASILREMESQIGNLSIGSYPFFKNNKIGAHIVLRSTDGHILRSAEKLLIERLTEIDLDPRIIDDP
jgi:molybdenum cofactor synthesis domain-containing protein